MSVFQLERCALVGMVHLLPLPGSPRWGGSIAAVREAALRDAERLLAGGCDAIIVENMGDLPYLRGSVDPSTLAAMTLATDDVVKLGSPVGVQVLSGAWREALGLCVATGASFLRIEAFAYAHVADEGWMDACAGPLLRSRAHLFGAGGPAIWADVQKKHAAHAVTADLDLETLAHGHAFCGADVLVITGVSTGQPTLPAHVVAAKSAGLPVVVGSGVTAASAHQFREVASAVIVGSYIKEGGNWQAPVDVGRVRAVRDALS